MDSNERKIVQELVTALGCVIPASDGYEPRTNLWNKYSAAKNMLAAAPQVAVKLPKWIDDKKGSDPLVDDLIAYIEQIAAPQVVADERAAIKQWHERYDPAQFLTQDKPAAMVSAMKAEIGELRAALAAVPAQAQVPIGYAPSYLTERIAAGDSAVMLTVTRKPLPGHGVTVALYTAPVQPVAVPDGCDCDDGLVWKEGCTSPCLKCQDVTDDSAVAPAAQEDTVSATGLSELREHLKIASVYGAAITLSSASATALYHSMTTVESMPAAQGDAKDEKAELVRAGLALMVSLKTVKDELEALKGDAKDAERLDFIEECTVDLRCHSVVLPGCDDADIYWNVIEHHMAEPNEREIGWGNTARQAIDAAIAAKAAS